MLEVERAVDVAPQTSSEWFLLADALSHLPLRYSLGPPISVLSLGLIPLVVFLDFLPEER